MSNFATRAAAAKQPIQAAGINPKAFVAYAKSFGIDLVKPTSVVNPGPAYNAFGECVGPWKLVLQKLESHLGKTSPYLERGDRSYVWLIKAPKGRQRVLRLDVEKGPCLQL